MGLLANIYPISSDSYEAAINGDLDEFHVESEPVDLDKTWHAISFLLTNKYELNFLKGGFQLEEISEHAQVHSPQDIKALNEYILTTSIDDIISKFDASEFNENHIYPENWDDNGADYICSYLNKFANLIAEASSEENGLFVILA